MRYTNIMPFFGPPCIDFLQQRVFRLHIHVCFKIPGGMCLLTGKNCPARIGKIGWHLTKITKRRMTFS